MYEYHGPFFIKTCNFAARNWVTGSVSWLLGQWAHYSELTLSISSGVLYIQEVKNSSYMWINMSGYLCMDKGRLLLLFY